MLEQGLELPSPPTVSVEPLPAPHDLLLEPLPLHGDDHDYSLPENRAGEARRRKRTIEELKQIEAKPLATSASRQPASSLSDNANATSSEPPLVDLSLSATYAEVEVVGVDCALLPRPTAFRLKRAMMNGVERSYKRHKVYNGCRRCGQPCIAETGHTKYRSYTFCPGSGVSKDVWIAEVDVKVAAKKSADK